MIVLLAGFAPGRHHRGVFRSECRRARIAVEIGGESSRLRHADDRTQLPGSAEYRPAVRLNASFSPVFSAAGRIAMSSQSGRWGCRSSPRQSRWGSGFRSLSASATKPMYPATICFNTGKRTTRPTSSCSISNRLEIPRRFARLAHRVSRRKPIVAIKSGRTKAGGRAASSHTAALAASEVAVDALFRQTGIIRPTRLRKCLIWRPRWPISPCRGEKGWNRHQRRRPSHPLCRCLRGQWTGDSRVHFGNTGQTGASLPAAASTANPVDMIASATPKHFAQSVETVLMSGEIDSLIAIYIPVGPMRRRRLHPHCERAQQKRVLPE